MRPNAANELDESKRSRRVLKLADCGTNAPIVKSFGFTSRKPIPR
jgi:hypothetical protein